MRTLRTISATAALALALGGSLFSVSAAQAATASSASIRASGGALWYSAGAGQANNLTVTAKYVDLDPSAYGDDVVITFRDKFDITIPTSVCRYPSATNHKVAECTVDADDSDRYGADLGDGNDTATVTDVLATISGGKGNDVIKGDSGAVLFGDDGNDRIDGGGGLYGEGSFGGAGNDTMTNCEDGCSGGPGNDSLTGTATGQDSNGLFGGTATTSSTAPPVPMSSTAATATTSCTAAAATTRSPAVGATTSCTATAATTRSTATAATTCCTAARVRTRSPAAREPTRSTRARAGTRARARARTSPRSARTQGPQGRA